jgi:hypothetical protein
MSGTVIAKYSAEFNLQTQIDVGGLSAEQIGVLKGRLAAANMSVAFDSAQRQILLDAATADFDAAVESAIKLEQTGAKYDVRSEAKGGGANTNVIMSSKGDANYNNCLLTFIAILAIGGIIVYAVCSGKSKSRSSYRSNRSYQKSDSTPYRSSDPYRYPSSRKYYGY